MAEYVARIVVRDLPRMRLLMWELHQMLERMADTDNPEFQNLMGIYSRWITDLDKDEPLTRR